MNLNHLFGYQNNNAANPGISGSVNTPFNGPPADMSAFKAGQTVQGEVVAAENNEVVLKLEDGSLISAKLTKDIPLSIGQTMTLEIKSNNGSRLSLSPLFENMGHDPNALKALAAAGMPATARNLEMVTLLMREGMPVDKNALLLFSRHVAANPGEALSSLAELGRLGLPVNAENIQQLEAYKNYEHQISAAVRDITDGLIDDMGRMVAQGEGERALNLFRQVVSIFGDQSAAAVGANGETAVAAGGANAGGEGILGGEMPAALQNISLSEGSTPAPVMPYPEAFFLSPAKADAQHTPSASTQSATLAPAPVAADAAPMELGALLRAAGFSVELTEAVGNLATEQGRIAEGMVGERPPQDAAAVPAPTDALTGAVNVQMALPDMGVVAENNQLPVRQTPLPNIITLLSEELAVPGRIDTEILATLLGRKDFQALIKNDLENVWLMKPEDVSKEEALKEHIKQIFAQNSRLSEALSAAGRGDTPVAQMVNNLSSNLNFINQLNQAFTYVQVPLKMNGEATHGELFIYTNKKNLAKKDGAVSALLHLDMEHLGPLDVHIAMKNKQVSTKFYLADEAALNLVARHIDSLDERLRQRGYTMKSDFVERGADKSPVDELLSAGKHVGVIGSYSFDARA